MTRTCSGPIFVVPIVLGKDRNASSYDGVIPSFWRMVSAYLYLYIYR
jgi:hypothetical protein